MTRTECNIARGIAILGIMLHNFTHWLGPMVKENEYTFTQHNVDRLLMELAEPTLQLPAHLLSFFGHYGVPVFVFLSAYGLVKKYEAGSSQSPLGEVRWGVWLWQHFKKLFSMMIVGYALFVMVDYMTPHPRHYEFWNVVGQLGMFSNFYERPDFDIWPGPYWYFGLMLQLYAFYWLMSLCRGIRKMEYVWGALAIVLLLFQLMLAPTSDALNWYRYNLFGHLPLFIMSLWYARHEDQLMRYMPKTTAAWLCVAIVSTVLIVLTSLTFTTWIITPFLIMPATVAFIKVMPSLLQRPFEYLGVISSTIFVLHPITRKVIIPISHNGDIYAGLLLFAIATIVLARKPLPTFPKATQS